MHMYVPGRGQFQYNIMPRLRGLKQENTFTYGSNLMWILLFYLLTLKAMLEFQHIEFTLIVVQNIPMIVFLYIWAVQN